LKEKKQNKPEPNTAETVVEETKEVSETGDVPEAEVVEQEQPPEIDELAIIKDQLLRQAAEYDNYRKRTAKERMELVPEITAKVITEILPVLDSVERALKTDCTDENFKKGVEMIYESFKEKLASLGVEEITAEDFDPSLHQAVQHVDKEGAESGKVAEIFQKGYKIGNKVIRFAMVSIVK